jgi:putative NADH-flavin reductase
MKIALIGASGFVGSHVLQEALNRGHKVTAIIRHPEEIKVKHENLSVKKGDALKANEVSDLVKGHDAVISTYNPGWKNPDIYNEYLKGAQSIQEEVKKAGVKRLLVVGGGGSLEAAPGKQFVDTPEFPSEWKQGALAARDYLNIIREEKELDWTFLSPAVMLVPGERTGNFKLGTDRPIMNEKGESKISVEDLSVAIIDEIENPRHIRQRFTAGY